MVSCPCNTCFWYALVLTVRKKVRKKESKKYITRRILMYFLQPARERIKNTYCMGKRPFLYFCFYKTYFCCCCYTVVISLESVVVTGQHNWCYVFQVGNFPHGKPLTGFLEVCGRLVSTVVCWEIKRTLCSKLVHITRKSTSCWQFYKWKSVCVVPCLGKRFSC